MFKITWSFWKSYRKPQKTHVNHSKTAIKSRTWFFQKSKKFELKNFDISTLFSLKNAQKLNLIRFLTFFIRQNHCLTFFIDKNNIHCIWTLVNSGITKWINSTFSKSMIFAWFGSKIQCDSFSEKPPFPCMVFEICSDEDGKKCIFCIHLPWWAFTGHREAYSTRQKCLSKPQKVLWGAQIHGFRLILL